MGRVLVTRRLPDGGLDPLAAHELIGPNADDSPFSPDELRAHAGSVDAIVSVLTDKIDADLLEAGAAANLRVVANVAVGYDNIDVAAARQHGIVVCNTPGVLDETTADLAFTLILAASRLVHDAEADLRSHRWDGWGITQYLGRDVHGATLGIVGYGRIGRAVARRASGFGMQVLHHARTDTGEHGYVADLDALLAESDVVSLHVPGGDATRNLIDARRIALMRPTAVLVNTARGLRGRRSRPRRCAAHRPLVCRRSRRVRARAGRASEAAQCTPHGVTAAHRLGIAGDAHSHGAARGVGGRHGSRRRSAGQRRRVLVSRADEGNIDE